MSAGFTREPVDDCFDGTAVYLYRLESAIDEEFVRALGRVGRLELFSDFPRPFFRVIAEDGTQLKGVLGDQVFKAIYPRGGRETAMVNTEKVLAVLTGRG